MSRWFRWYEGTSEDGKFRLVARLSRVTVRDVIALWAFMLEDAANLAHRGVCKRNEDFMASILDFEDGVVEEILAAMQTAGMISVGHGDISVCNWDKRQFEGDTDPTANERQKRHRNKNKPVTNASVTRDSRPPDTDTDTDKERGSADAPDENVVPLHPFVFEGGTVRLNQMAFDRWRQAFHAIPDIEAVLTAADDYYTANPPADGKWFFPVSRWLQKEHERAIKERRRRVPDV